MKSLKKNLTYQTVYQVLITITPLITAPYLSRKLGAEGLGIYSFTQSIVNYFMLFAMLGFTNYGTRTIAMCENETEERKVFNEIYILQLICSSISICMYILLSILYNYNTLYLLLQSFWVFSCLFDVTWYFFGKEEYKITVTRNIVIKILTICAILIFVKKPEDISIYIVIMSASTFLSQFILWCILRKKIYFSTVNIKSSFKKHFKAVIVLFIPYLAMSIYHIMDKTMLGLLSSNDQSGYYYNSDKVINIPLGILNGLGIVMLSRMSTIQKEENKKEKTLLLINNSISGIMCASVAFAFGIAAVSQDFVYIFFGEGYEKCIPLIMIFSVVLVCKALSNIMQSQYMLPFKKERELTACVIVGAFINLVANYVFIKILNYGALGATIGTLITEFIETVLQILVVNKNIKILQSIYKSLVYVIFGVIMFIAVKLIAMININILERLIIEILVGGIIYIILSYSFLKLSNNELLNFFRVKVEKE